MRFSILPNGSGRNGERTAGIRAAISRTGCSGPGRLPAAEATGCGQRPREHERREPDRNFPERMVPAVLTAAAASGGKARVVRNARRQIPASRQEDHPPPASTRFSRTGPGQRQGCDPAGSFSGTAGTAPPVYHRMPGWRLPGISRDRAGDRHRAGPPVAPQAVLPAPSEPARALPRAKNRQALRAGQPATCSCTACSGGYPPGSRWHCLRRTGTASSVCSGHDRCGKPGGRGHVPAPGSGVPRRIRSPVQDKAEPFP